VSLELWDKLKSPPKERTKIIDAGRLKGRTDINPQWRYEVMTDVFGPCGIGWKYEVTNKWTEKGSNDQLLVFVDVNLYIKHEDKWSEPIPGNGGDFIVKKESNGLYTSDEAYKMAITDALGNAMKMIGVAADVYGGQYGKYDRQPEVKHNSSSTQKEPPKQDVYACESCKKSIPQGVHAFSKKKYGKSLCQDCQKKAVSA